jgi:hypothetical protein
LSSTDYYHSVFSVKFDPDTDPDTDTDTDTDGDNSLKIPLSWKMAGIADGVIQLPRGSPLNMFRP